MKEKKNYVEPTIEVYLLVLEDSIAASGGTQGAGLWEEEY